MSPMGGKYTDRVKRGEGGGRGLKTLDKRQLLIFCLNAKDVRSESKSAGNHDNKRKKQKVCNF